jgi:geranylgeranyl reductase family protein
MVIVVGAGPAGATAARTLAKAGVTVRLLERSNFPRNKPCGGAISLRVVKRFPYVDSALARIPTHRVARLHLEGPDGESTLIEAAEPVVLLVRRVEFDALLVSLAVEAGVELVPGAEVVQAKQSATGVSLVARDGRRFEAPIVIAADGVHSVVARRLGINRVWPRSAVALDMMEETPRTVLHDADPSALWVAYGYEPAGSRGSESRDRRRAPEGYAYVFPKRDHVNVGVGYLLDHYQSAIGRAPYELQRELVAELSQRGVLSGESVRKNFTPFLIPVDGPLDHPGRGRVLVAGDAGGFVNGFTAEGIYYAMVSGDLAAKAAVEGPVDGLAGRYRQACRAEMGAELRMSVLIRRYLFHDRRRIAGVIRGARRAPRLTARILDFAKGDIRYPELRRWVVRRAPGLAGRLMWERVVHGLTSRSSF